MNLGRPVRVIRHSQSLFDLQLGEIREFRELLLFLAWRDIRVRYKQTLLGGIWIILQPLIAVSIFSFVFGRFSPLSTRGIPYFLSTLVALVPWQFFSNALIQASGRVVDDAALVSKCYFPRILSPVAAVLSGLVDFAIAFALLLVIVTFSGFYPGPRIILLPIFIFLAILTVLGTSFWLSALNVRFRDVRYTLPFLAQVWFFCSPVIYPTSLIPAHLRGWYGLNPMVPVLDGMRWILLGAPEPHPMAFGISAVLVVLLFVGGLIFFQRMARSFADVI